MNDEAIRLMKERGTFLVPTTALTDLMNLANAPAVVQRKADLILRFTSQPAKGGVGRSKDSARY